MSGSADDHEAPPFGWTLAEALWRLAPPDHGELARDFRAAMARQERWARLPSLAAILWPFVVDGVRRRDVAMTGVRAGGVGAEPITASFLPRATLGLEDSRLSLGDCIFHDVRVWPRPADMAAWLGDTPAVAGADARAEAPSEEDAALTWFLAQLGEGKITATKKQWQSRTQHEFSELSDRGFLAIWKLATKKFPNLARPGAKKKR